MNLTVGTGLLELAHDGRQRITYFPSAAAATAAATAATAATTIIRSKET